MPCANIKQTFKKLSKETMHAKVLPVVGPIILPILFGMCLTSLNVLGNRAVTSQGNSTESIDELVSAPFSKQSGWEFLSISMFIGTFTFSLALFIMGLLKKTPYAHFKSLFTSSAFLIAATNLICAYSSAFSVLFAARFCMGVGTGIACALGPVYYIKLLGPKAGSVVATLQGLFINLGILIEGRISHQLSGQDDKTASYIFSIIAVMSFVSLVFNIVFTKNLHDTNQSKFEDVEIIRAVRSGVPSKKKVLDKSPVLMIAACIIMQVVQQMTGINPILSIQSVVFNPALDNTATAKGFFDSAGFIGMFISIGILMVKNDCLSWMALLTGVGACVSLVIGWLGSGIVMCWAAGFYLLFFSIGLANLPWMLPSILLKAERNVSMAAGLGSLSNAVVSCAAVFGYISAYSLLGKSLFGVFALFCLTEGVLGFYLLVQTARNERYIPTADNSKASRLIAAGEDETEM
ncbi:hypothetical protein NEMIN01_1260 [Nematocida minor]|uniref:uncharacterized protein n=1 Tax=Nematocida minor TaxID=1912983 RepID=UPI00221E959B|nr:uncharacterized protein NEMIN01_1260 [Nematocida minor]KAI5190858.1 hypothetical protein NEMIN01_1260 [Nematocida minor]